MNQRQGDYLVALRNKNCGLVRLADKFELRHYMFHPEATRELSLAEGDELIDKGLIYLRPPLEKDYTLTRKGYRYLDGYEDVA